MAFYRPFPFSNPHPKHCRLRSILTHRFRVATLMADDRFGLPWRRLCPPTSFHLAATPTAKPPAVAQFHYVCDHKLLIPQFRCLIPTPRVPYGVGRICMEVCTAPCTCSFRAVNAGVRLSELQWARSPYTQHVPPTHKGNNRLHYQPTADICL